MFSLKGIEEGHIPLSKHFECNIEVGGQVVHHIGILVKKDKVSLVDSKGRKVKTPALLSSNLIHIALNNSVKYSVKSGYIYLNVWQA